MALTDAVLTFLVNAAWQVPVVLAAPLVLCRAWRGAAAQDRAAILQWAASADAR